MSEITQWSQLFSFESFLTLLLQLIQWSGIHSSTAGGRKLRSHWLRGTAKKNFFLLFGNLYEIMNITETWYFCWLVET